MANFINSLKSAVSGQYKEKDESAAPFESLVECIETVDSSDRQLIRAGTFPVHVSTAIKFCARQHFLMAQADKEFESGVSSADRVLWAMGKASEAHNRSSLIKGFKPHNAYGIWQCRCETMEMTGLGRNPHGKRCNICGSDVLYKYEELPLHWDDLIVGNPDLLLRMGPDKKLRVIEFKSMDKDKFKDLQFAEPYHKMQAYFYVKLLEKNRKRFDDASVELDLENFIVFYTSKGYQFNFSGRSVHKEFQINIARDLTDGFKSEMEKIINEVKRAKAATLLPKNECCTSAKDGIKKNCPVVQDCFSIH